MRDHARERLVQARWSFDAQIARSASSAKRTLDSYEPADFSQFSVANGGTVSQSITTSLEPLLNFRDGWVGLREQHPMRFPARRGAAKACMPPGNS
jgi:hypothetical protein